MGEEWTTIDSPILTGGCIFAIFQRVLFCFEYKFGGGEEGREELILGRFFGLVFGGVRGGREEKGRASSFWRVGAVGIMAGTYEHIDWPRGEGRAKQKTCGHCHPRRFFPPDLFLPLEGCCFVFFVVFFEE